MSIIAEVSSASLALHDSRMRATSVCAGRKFGIVFRKLRRAHKNSSGA
jgi:hypothetical protein